MSKVIQVMNAMISNPSKITDVIRGGPPDSSEFFFLYDKKFKWSIALGARDVYNLYYYPGNLGIKQIASLAEWNPDLEMVRYSTESLTTKEARESFIELYELVKEKLYNLDTVFDDIIKGAEG